jgi:hypothetical protein
MRRNSCFKCHQLSSIYKKRLSYSTSPNIRLIPIITSDLPLLLNKIMLNLLITSIIIRNPFIIIRQDPLISRTSSISTVRSNIIRPQKRLIRLQCRPYFPYLERVAFFSFLVLPATVITAITAITTDTTTALLQRDIITSVVPHEPASKVIF